MKHEKIVYFTEKVPMKWGGVDDKYVAKLKEQVYKQCEISKSSQNYALDCNVLRFSHLCPNCAVELKAEWVIVKMKHDSASSKEREYEKDCAKIKSALNEHNKRASEEMHCFCDLENCLFCDAKLKKTYPFFDSSPWSAGKSKRMDIPRWMTWWKNFEWRDTYEKTHPYVVFFQDDSIRDKNVFDYVEEIREEELKKLVIDSALKAYTDYIHTCDIPHPTKPLKSEKNIEFLKEYLHNLLNLETNILCMSKRLKELYLLRRENDRNVAYEQGLPIFNFAKEIDQKNSALLELTQERQNIENQPLFFATVEYPREPIKPEVLKANLFNKKKIAALNAQAQAEYQEAVKQYLVAVEKCKEQTEKNKTEAENQKTEKIKEYSERIDKSASDIAMAKHKLAQKKANAGNTPTPAVGQKYILDTEITSLEKILKKTFQCRNELYSYNVIFDKYRNIVALSSFYEYFMTGRCESLEGANGAYNIYESEIRMNQIISQLDEVIISLDQIKKNQYMIYNKLEEMNTSLHNLESSMEKVTVSLNEIKVNTDSMNKYLDSIEKNTAVIAHNTAVSAYYSKVNAELTNALGFMVALK